MPFVQTGFPGLTIFEPVVFGDDRGYFFESFSERTWKDIGFMPRFIQDNQARSVHGVVRGLHFQLSPHAQTKLIRALQGTILDVVVDLRDGSPTYRQVYTIELSAENKKQLLVPKGFAHGYSVLSETAEVFYKCDQFYNKSAEGGLAFNDQDLNIDWRVELSKMIVSEKDMYYPNIGNCEHNFKFEARYS